MSPVRVRGRAAKARAPEHVIEITIPSVANLKFCAMCSCVTNHETGACEYQEWHEQPRAD